MAKNDWNNSDDGTRSRMNQPFWLASGTYNSGAARIELQVSPGSVRFQATPLVVSSGQPQQVLINNPQITRWYTVYVRRAGTFMVSGTTDPTLLVTMAAPRSDAEPIGTISTGASLSTANLMGPWNSSVFDQDEQRGQYVALSAAQPRMVYSETDGTSLRAATPGSIGSIQNNVAVSGLLFLATNDIQQSGKDVTLVRGSVTWVPSGLVSGGTPALVAAPVFTLFKVQPSTGSAVTLRDASSTLFITTAAGINPDGNFFPLTTTVEAVVVPLGTRRDYRLSVDTTMLSDPNASIRIVSKSLYVLPGFRGEQDGEPTD